jgi:hypothetical protein
MIAGLLGRPVLAEHSLLVRNGWQLPPCSRQPSCLADTCAGQSRVAGLAGHSPCPACAGAIQQHESAHAGQEPLAPGLGGAFPSRVIAPDGQSVS